MKWQWLVLIVMACQVPLTTEPELIIPEVEAKFEFVPLKYYSYPPSMYDAIEAVATQTPADTTWWKAYQRAGLSEWQLLGEDLSMPFERAGHRWYFGKGFFKVEVMMIAWGPVARADTAYWRQP